MLAVFLRSQPPWAWDPTPHPQGTPTWSENPFMVTCLKPALRVRLDIIRLECQALAPPL